MLGKPCGRNRSHRRFAVSPFSRRNPRVLTERMRGKLITSSVKSIAGGGEVDTDQRSFLTSRTNPDTVQGIDHCLVSVSREVLSELQ